jgi:ABC-type glutathione transport system ATPase component
VLYFSHPNQHTPKEIKLISDLRRRNSDAGFVVFWVKLTQRSYSRSIPGLYRFLKRQGIMAVHPPNSKYVPKPYEAMQRPRKRFQIDIKFVPSACLKNRKIISETFYQFTAKDEKNIISARKQADFGEKLSAFSEGVKTQMTREFDEEGLSLSGGEKQKSWLARVFAGTGKTVVRDEASAALDPVAEYNINRQIINSSKKKSIVLISHKLTATRMADHIIMLENGEIIESGSHEEWMKLVW